MELKDFDASTLIKQVRSLHSDIVSGNVWDMKDIANYIDIMKELVSRGYSIKLTIANPRRVPCA